MPIAGAILQFQAHVRSPSIDESVTRRCEMCLSASRLTGDGRGDPCEEFPLLRIVARMNRNGSSHRCLLASRKRTDKATGRRSERAVNIRVPFENSDCLRVGARIGQTNEPASGSPIRSIDNYRVESLPCCRDRRISIARERACIRSLEELPACDRERTARLTY